MAKIILLVYFSEIKKYKKYKKVYFKVYAHNSFKINILFLFLTPKIYFILADPKKFYQKKGGGRPK